MNVAQIIALRDQKGARIQEILDACKREGRNRTEAEDAEYASLVEERASLEAQARELNERQNSETQNPQLTMNEIYSQADALLRQKRNEGGNVTIALKRSVLTTAAHDGDGILVVQEQEMLKPLRAGLIWDKLGIPVQSGLAGTLRWPLHSKATATWEDEASELVDSSISFSKLEMKGKRLGIAIPVSREELNDSEGIVERVVTEEMPMACADLINNAMLTLVAETVENGSKVDKAVKGPFAMKVVSNALKGCHLETIAVDGSNMKDLRKVCLKLKAAVYGAGVQRKAPAFVMNETTKALCEDEKIDAGSGRFLCEDDKILGIPVFASNELPDGVIGFGDWSYQAAGFFGETSLVIDPYTLARKFSTDFVLNMRFGTATLREDAFAIAMTSAAQNTLKSTISAIGASGD